MCALAESSLPSPCPSLQECFLEQYSSMYALPESSLPSPCQSLQDCLLEQYLYMCALVGNTELIALLLSVFAEMVLQQYSSMCALAEKAVKIITMM